MSRSIAPLAVLAAFSPATAQLQPVSAAAEHGPDARARIRAAVTLQLEERKGRASFSIGTARVPFARVERDLIWYLETDLVTLRLRDLILEEWELKLVPAVVPPVEPTLAADATPLDRYRAHQDARFDRAFFRGPAKDWPPIVRESIVASGDNRAFWRNLERPPSGSDGAAKPLPLFWQDLMRGWVTKQIVKTTGVAWPRDGIEPWLVLVFGEHEWSVAEAWKRANELAPRHDLRQAATAAVIVDLLRAELARGEHWLDDETFARSLDNYRARMDSPFDLEASAGIDGFPNVAAYLATLRLLWSFERSIAAEVDRAAIAAHAQRAGHSIFGVIRADLLRFLCHDPDTGKPRTNGMAAARHASLEAAAELATGTPFDRLRETVGDRTKRDRWRLRRESLDGLRRSCGESLLTDVVCGPSIAEHLFRVDASDVPLGPFRSPDGYLIAVVLEKQRHGGEIEIDAPETLAVVRDHYVRERFRRWVEEALDRIAPR